MAKEKHLIQVYLDPIANTLNIWWDDPIRAHSSEEVDSFYRNDVIVRDKTGRPISLEVIGVFPSELNIAERLKNIIPSKDEPFLLKAATPQQR